MHIPRTLYILGPTLAGVMLSASPAWAGIVAGPYLQQVTRTTVRVMWQTSTATTDTLSYGTSTAYGKSVQDSSATTLHSQVLSGLTAGTAYYYQVNDAGVLRTGRCTTAPLPGTDFTFAVYGDNRSSPSNASAVAAAIVKFSPVLMMTSGDYTDGTSSASTWQSQFFTPAAGLLANTPIIPAIGNHDSEQDDAQTLVWSYFPRPGTTNYYSYDYGDLHIAVVDTNLSYATGSAQYTWLENDLASTPQPLVLVLHHYPVYSSGKHGSTADMDSNLRPLYEKYKVTAVLNGHDHLYERSVRNGIPYFVLGGGGAPLYSATLTSNPYEVKGESTYNFGIFTVSQGALSMTAYRPDGSVIESVVLKEATIPTPTPTPFPTPTPSPTPTPDPGDGSGGCSGLARTQSRSGALPFALIGLAFGVMTRKRNRRG